MECRMFVLSRSHASLPRREALIREPDFAHAKCLVYSGFALKIEGL